MDSGSGDVLGSDAGVTAGTLVRMNSFPILMMTMAKIETPPMCP